MGNLANYVNIKIMLIIQLEKLKIYQTWENHLVMVMMKILMKIQYLILLISSKKFKANLVELKTPKNYYKHKNKFLFWKAGSLKRNHC